MACAALILSLCALYLSLVGILLFPAAFLAYVISILSLIFSFIAISKHRKGGAGLTCSIIAHNLSVIGIVIFILFLLY